MKKTKSGAILNVRHKNKGITLVALVITIIIMLILVAVTVSYSIKSGLLTKAQDAKIGAETEEEKAKIGNLYQEYLVDYETGKLVGTTLASYMSDKTIEGATITEGEDEKIVIVTFATSKNTYTVTENGTIALAKAYASAVKDTNGYLTENAIYTDGESIAVIPAGFKVSEVSGEQTIKTGLVIKDSESNEFVWVPVENAIWDGKTAIQGNYTPMVKSQSSNTSNYEGILYDFTSTSATQKSNYGIGTTSFREPDIVTYFDWNTECLSKAGITESENQNQTYFKNQMQIEFNNMVASVNKYKGFYVARYELSTTAQGKLASKAGVTVTTARTNSNMWYGLYNICKTYTNSKDSVTSNMIYGCQYDAMLIWMQKANINVTATSISGDTDKLNNVYDLLGGYDEWTQEARGTNWRIFRGDNTTEFSSPTERNIFDPNHCLVCSSRATLYIK